MQPRAIRIVWVLAGVLAWAALPALASRHVIDVLVFAGLYTIAGLGVSYLLGHCGIVTLAQSVFYGIGAYSVAYFSAHLALPSLVAFAVGALLCALVAVLVGWPILRLSGHFLALATLALSIIGGVIFLEWDWLTGGTLGIGGLPKLELLGWQLNTPQRFYYLVWPIALLLMWLKHNLTHSRTGLAMRAMRDAPDAAAVAGVEIHRLKVKMFVLSAVLGSLAGSLFAHYVGFISVDSFTVDRSISFLLLAVLGGAQTTWGPALGAVFITVVPELLSRFGDIHAVLFALTLILVVVFLPQGLGGAVQQLVSRGKPLA